MLRERSVTQRFFAASRLGIVVFCVIVTACSAEPVPKELADVAAQMRGTNVNYCEAYRKLLALDAAPREPTERLRSRPARLPAP